jgi:hypothetical protein
MYALPDGLIEAIRNGSCVAFIGSGFCVPQGLPQWKALLEKVVGNPVSDDLRYVMQNVLGKATLGHRDYWEAAQRIEESLGRRELLARMRSELRVDEPLRPAMDARIETFAKIPFHSVITTNFDSVIPGSTVGDKQTLAELLRSTRPEYDERAVMQFVEGGRNQALGAPVVKIHGDVRTGSGVVFTLQDYRTLLHGTAQYASYLRAIFASKTMLFLGCSLTDEYLNEIRSEVICMLGVTPQDFASGVRKPFAYAIMNDWSNDKCNYYLRNEGIHILNFDTKNGSDWSGFDLYLQALECATNPLRRLSRLRILWCHRHSQLHNVADRDGMFLQKVIGANTQEILNLDEGIRLISASTDSYDIVISSWGDAMGDWALQLLSSLPQNHPPVIVFSSHNDKAKRTKICLHHGGFAYCSTWQDLLSELLRYERLTA